MINESQNSQKIQNFFKISSLFFYKKIHCVLYHHLDLLCNEGEIAITVKFRVHIKQFASVYTTAPGRHDYVTSV